MARKAFYSFHYEPDNWRASMVRNIGVVEGNRPCSDNKWETVTSGGNAAIRRWITAQMHGRSCTIVLIGEKTAGRKWIDYEIKKSWGDNMGILGIHVHRLKDRNGYQARKGGNPFAHLMLDDTPLSKIVPVHNPPYASSAGAYNYIRDNVGDWVEEALAIRADN